MNQMRGTITMEQAAKIRELRASFGWGPRTIAKHIGVSAGAANGVIYLGNMSPAMRS